MQLLFQILFLCFHALKRFFESLQSLCVGLCVVPLKLQRGLQLYDLLQAIGGLDDERSIGRSLRFELIVEILHDKKKEKKMEYQKIEFELFDLSVFLFELMLKTLYFALQFRRIADRCARSVLLLFSLHHTPTPEQTATEQS